jgi:riboflavin kinase/FMN adenylyltransferase
MAKPLPGPDLGPPPGRPRVSLTIGKFDGVHAGHRHLAAHLIAAADAAAVRSVAVVLHPDPVTVLAGREVPLLTTVAERGRRLREFGVDHVWHMPFDRALAELSPEEFWDRLADHLDIHTVVVGPDFAFGHDRAGKLATLGRFSRERGFDLVVVDPLSPAGEKLGSRALRGLIEAGDVATAATWMRAAPRVTGRVVTGAQRGRTLGFPTANLALSEDFTVPANGVYTVRATWTWADGRAPDGNANGLASIGVRPTFDHGERIVEVYLLDFDDDLYGADMTVDFVARQRGEERFASAEALVEQMHRDEAEARAWLAEQALPAWASVAAHSFVVRGRDLAELCEAALRAVGSARPAGGGTATPSLRRQISVAADGATPAARLDLWLAQLADATEHRVQAAQVYCATQDGIQALVTVAGASPRYRFRVDPALVEVLPQGRLVATISVRSERASGTS